MQTAPLANAPARRPIPTTPILVLLLAIALGLRLHGVYWDSGTDVHPDERAIGNWVSGLQFPHGLGDLFNRDSHWNPSTVATGAHDPSGFNYGSLPLYLIFVFAHLMDWLGGFLPWWSSWHNGNAYGNIILGGRVLSAVADTVTVYLVYLIGARLAGKLTGLYAAALATFAVLSIQLAHFATVDVLLGTFATGTLLASIDLFTHGRTRDDVIVGIWLAAAIATKASAVPLVPVVLAAHLWQRGRLGDLLGWRSYFYPLITALTGMVALFVFQPYTFVDWTDFWTAVQLQRNLADGTSVQFYTLKWIGTAPIAYPLEQLTFYSLGLPLALLAYAGAIYAGVRTFTARRNAGALVLLWVLVYFISAGILYMKYLRYMEPIVPALCVLAALFISALARNRAWLVGGLARRAGLALGAVVLLLNTCYGLAYEHIYARPITHVQATCWLFAHVPSGTPVAQDVFDETIPVGLPPGVCASPATAYPTAPDMPHYDSPDTMATAETLGLDLARAQYYFIHSRRAMDTIFARPSQYPYYDRFYRLLFSVKPGAPDALGYTLVKSFAEHPQLGPWTYQDYGANQNFNEYDHPPVWIFQNTGHLSPQAIVDVLDAHGTIPPAPLYVTPTKSLRLTQKDLAANAHTPTYSQMFPPDGIPMRAPIPVWLLMVELIGLLTLPIGLRLFGRLRDGGFVLCKTAGILLLSWFAWILPSLHIMEYSRGEIALCLLPLAAISLLWGVRLRDIGPILRARRVEMLVTEAVFLAAYAGFVWIRMLYPDLWHLISGGEKTMDFTFLNGIVRSRVMPPIDPFFGGGYINYYYYGHFTVATLLKLAGITPAVAINLAIPTFFALAIASCVSLGLTLAGRIPYALLSGVLAMLGGNLVGGQVLVGDLQAASPFHDRLQPVTSAGADVFLFGGLINAVSLAWSAFSGFLRGTLSVVLGVWQVLFSHAPMPRYAFGYGWPWDESRIYDNHTVITEFPYWTVIFADPHAHMWDVPFVLCAIGLAFNLLWRGREGEGPSPAASKPLLPGGSLIIWPVIGILVGAIGPTNPWDLATALGAIVLAAFIGLLLAGRTVPRALGGAVARLIAVAIFALGCYLPFYQHFQSFYSQIGWTLFRHQTSLADFCTHFGVLLFVLLSYLIFAVLHDTQVGLWIRGSARAGLFTMYYWDRRRFLPHYFALAHRLGIREELPTARVEYKPAVLAALLAGGALIFWLLLFGYWALGIMGGIIAVSLVLTLDADPGVRRLRRMQYRPGWPAGAVLGIAGTILLVLLIANYWVLAVITAMIAAALLLLVDQRQPRSPAVHALHLLIVVGLGLVAAGEIVYVKDFYEGDPLRFRTNTVFKLYEEAWILMGVAAGVGLARLLGPLMGGASRRLAERARGWPGGWTWGWLAALVLLFVGAEIGPLRITSLRVQERQTWPTLANVDIGPTLDGSLFIKYLYPGDYAAIQWIDSHISGSPIMLQSHHGGYRNFAARITMFTGLPSLVNWGGENSQQRYHLQQANATQIYPDDFTPREQDADTIYATPDPDLALSLLHQYHVAYIYVGDIERHGFPDSDVATERVGYPAAGLAKFELMVIDGQLQRLYTNHWGVVIYHVVR